MNVYQQKEQEFTNYTATVVREAIRKKKHFGKKLIDNQSHFLKKNITITATIVKAKYINSI